MTIEAGFFDDVFTAIDRVASEIFNLMCASRLFSGPGFGTQSGFRYISYTYEDVDPAYEIQHVCLPLNGPDATLPFEYLARYMGSMSFGVSYSSTGADPDKAAAIAAWRTGYVGTWATAIEELCGASCELGEETSVEVVTGFYERQTQTVEVSTPGRTYVLVFEANIGPDLVTEGPLAYWHVVPHGYQAQINLPTQAPQELSAIAESLSDIAMQDFNIALNNGQAIFSVKGKSTTG